MQNAWFNKKEFDFPLKSVKLEIKLSIISENYLKFYSGKNKGTQQNFILYQTCFQSMYIAKHLILRSQDTATMQTSNAIIPDTSGVLLNVGYLYDALKLSKIPIENWTDFSNLD